MATAPIATTADWGPISIRLSRGQREDWHRRARQDGKPLATWIRIMVQKQILHEEGRA
jgi:alkylated DNA nucleotide flippase Atl1